MTNSGIAALLNQPLCLTVNRGGIGTFCLLALLTFSALGGCSKSDQCKINLRHDCAESETTYYKAPPPPPAEEPKKADVPSAYTPEIAVGLQEDLLRELFYDCRKVLAKTETNPISMSTAKVKINSHKEFPFDRATYSSLRTGELTSVVSFGSTGDDLKTVTVGIQRPSGVEKDPIHIRVMPGDNVIKYRLETCHQLDKSGKDPLCLDWRLEEESQVKVIVAIQSTVKGVCERKPKCFGDKVIKYRDCVPVPGSSPAPAPQ